MFNLANATNATVPTDATIPTNSTSSGDQGGQNGGLVLTYIGGIIGGIGAVRYGYKRRKTVLKALTNVANGISNAKDRLVARTFFRENPQVAYELPTRIEGDGHVSPARSFDDLALEDGLGRRSQAGSTAGSQAGSQRDSPPHQEGAAAASSVHSGGTIFHSARSGSPSSVASQGPVPRATHDVLQAAHLERRPERESPPSNSSQAGSTHSAPAVLQTVAESVERAVTLGTHPKKGEQGESAKKAGKRKVVQKQ